MLSELDKLVQRRVLGGRFRVLRSDQVRLGVQVLRELRSILYHRGNREFQEIQHVRVVQRVRVHRGNRSYHPYHSLFLSGPIAQEECSSAAHKPLPPAA